MIVLLNPVFNCSNNLLSFSADKVTTGTCNFASFLLNVAPVGLLILGTAAVVYVASTVSLYSLLVNMQFSDQILQKFLKYFNGTTISASPFSKLLPSNLSVILVL